MKTAEEEARDFLTGEGAKYPLPKAVSIFANAKAKALLEEAAEKMKKKLLTSANYDWLCGYNEAVYRSQQITLSLIPKEQ